MFPTVGSTENGCNTRLESTDVLRLYEYYVWLKHELMKTLETSYNCK